MKDKLFNRVLTLKDVIGIEVGTTIGAGVFVWTGIAIATTGSSLPLSYAIAVIPIIFAMIPIALLGSAIPTVGGSYKYPSRMLSPFIAFSAVWAYILGAFIGFFPLYAVNTVEYIEKMFPDWHPSEIEIKLIASGVLFFFYVINIFGAKLSSNIQLIMIVLLILGLIVYAVSGLPKVQAENFSDFWSNDISAILMGASLLTFTYMGSNSIIELGGEIKNPGKTIPRSLMISFPIILIVYILVSIVSVGVLPWQEVAGMPLTESAYIIFSRGFLYYFFCLSAVLALTTTLNASLIWGTKSLIILCDDGILPKSIAKINKKFSTPHIILTLIAAIGIAVIFLDVDQKTLTIFATIGGLLIFIPVLIAALIFPKKLPDLYEKSQFKPKKILIIISVLIGILLSLGAIANLLMEGLTKPSNSSFEISQNLQMKYELFLSPIKENYGLDNKILIGQKIIDDNIIIAEGEELSLSGNILIPNNFPQGEYYLFINFNPNNNPADLTIKNNIYSNMIPIKIDSNEYVNDFEIVDAEIINTISTDQIIQIQAEVKNIRTLNSPLNISIPLKTEFIYENNEFSYIVNNTFNIISDNEENFSIIKEFDLPDSLPSGNYNIKLKLNTYPSLVEKNYFNNSYIIENVVIHSSNNSNIKLISSSFIEDKENERLNLNLEFTSNNNLIQKIEINGKIQICESRNKENSNILSSENFVGSIIFNSDNYGKLLTSIPNSNIINIPSGNYPVMLDLNCLCYIKENEDTPLQLNINTFSDELINIDQTNSFPDIEIFNIESEESVLAGDQLNYNFTIRNNKGKNFNIFIIFLIWMSVGIIYYFIRRKFNPSIKKIYGKTDF